MKLLHIVSLSLLTIFTINVRAQDPTLVWAGSVKAKVSPNSTIGFTSAMATDNAGNVYITGYFAGTADFDFGPDSTNLISAGGNDIFLAKYTSSGNLLWAKNIGGLDNEQANAIIVKGNYVVIAGNLGEKVDFNPGAVPFFVDPGPVYGGFLAKYASDGSFVWAGAMAGSTLVDDVLYNNAIATDNQDNIYVAGYFKGGADFDMGNGISNRQSNGDEDLFIAKYNPDGKLLWAKSSGGTDYETAETINIDPKGNIYLTGRFASTQVDMDLGPGEQPLFKKNSKSTYDLYIVKYTLDGGFIWANAISGDGVVNCRSAVTDTGGIYLCGIFEGTYDFDPGPGTTNLMSNPDHGASFFLARYNSAGKYIWAENFGDEGADVCTSIAADAKNNLYITGSFTGVTDFDPSPSNAFLHATDFDIFLAKYDANGKYIWAKNFGSQYMTNRGNAVAIDNSGLLYLSGTFTKSIDFDPGPGVTILTTNHAGLGTNADVFIAKYTSGTLPLKLLSFKGQALNRYARLEWETDPAAQVKKFDLERSADGRQFASITSVEGKNVASGINRYSYIDTKPLNDINYYRLKQISTDNSIMYSKIVSVSFAGNVKLDIYPNPTTKAVTISFDNALYQQVQLVDEQGKVLTSKTNTTGLVNFSLTEFATGIYYIRLVGKAGLLIRPVIKNNY